MKSGKELILIAMKKEFKRLSRIADKAKAEADEYMSSGSEFIAIHNELCEIINSKETGKSVLKKLNDLQARRDRAEKIRKKDFIKLIDKQSDAEIDRDNLHSEICSMEWRVKMLGAA